MAGSCARERAGCQCRCGEAFYVGCICGLAVIQFGAHPLVGGQAPGLAGRADDLAQRAAVTVTPAQLDDPGHGVQLQVPPAGVAQGPAAVRTDRLQRVGRLLRLFLQPAARPLASFGGHGLFNPNAEVKKRVALLKAMVACGLV